MRNIDGSANRMTVLELEQYLKKIIPPNGLSREAIYNHIRRAGIKLDSKHKVDVAAFYAAYMGAKERDNKNLGTDPSQDPRRYKIVLECAILKIKHDELKGLKCDVADKYAAIREMAQRVRDTHAQWIANVKVMTGDPKVVADAERLRDRLFAWMREKCQESLKP